MIMSLTKTLYLSLLILLWSSLSQSSSSDSSDDNNNNNYDTTDSGDSINSNDTYLNISTPFNCRVGWDVVFIGQSAQFKLFRCDNPSYFIKFKLLSIKEYNNNGNIIDDNQITSFTYASARSGEYSSGNSSVYSWKDKNGNDAILNGVTLVYLFDISSVSVIFEVNIYLIEEKIILEYSKGNDSYIQQLDESMLKFDYYLENWPFESDNNELEIKVKLTTSGSNNDESDDEDDNGAVSYSFDDFSILMPQTYSHTDENGYETGKNVDIEFDPNENNNNQVNVICLFKNAGDAIEIFYDPVVDNNLKGESGGYSILNVNKINIISVYIIFIVYILL